MSEDLESWLDACGLSKYLPAFEENEVSIADLQYLTDDDLKEIGLPIGPRRRLLARISEGVPPEPVAATFRNLRPGTAAIDGTFL